jgi:hypothetical protein
MPLNIHALWQPGNRSLVYETYALSAAGILATHSEPAAATCDRRYRLTAEELAPALARLQPPNPATYCGPAIFTNLWARRPKPTSEV